MLYPLKFKPILKEVIWGGSRLAAAGKRVPKEKNPQSIGESWELSGVEGDESIVASGRLAGNSLPELIEVYMGELVGDGVYEKYGLEFPVLMKFIDSRDKLSVQVHPSDEFAEQMHSTRGKTEMWHILEAEPGSCLYLDFERALTEEEYDKAVEEGNLDAYLRRVEVHKGETYYVPAGTVHAIGAGVMLAEIQETSNITYRISDWGRLDKHGHPRELHTALAAEVVNLTPREDLNVTKPTERNGSVGLVACEHFVTNILEIDGAVELDYAPLDSFVAYMCVEGEVELRAMGEHETLSALETVLLPAEATDVVLRGKGKILEVYVDLRGQK